VLLYFTAVLPGTAPLARIDLPHPAARAPSRMVGLFKGLRNACTRVAEGGTGRRPHARPEATPPSAKPAALTQYRNSSPIAGQPSTCGPDAWNGQSAQSPVSCHVNFNGSVLAHDGGLGALNAREWTSPPNSPELLHYRVPDAGFRAHRDARVDDSP
jgi:hypothetical protein